MRKIRSIFCLVLLTFLLCAGFSSGYAHKKSGPSQRHYNCKMPPRDRNHGPQAPAHDINPLFRDLGLSPQQLNKAEKEYNKYMEANQRLHEKHSYSQGRNDEKIHKEMNKNETSFLKSMHKIMNPGQYKMFEMRYNSLYLNHPGCGDLRPGNDNCGGCNANGDFGPIKRGPQPQMMTRPGGKK